MRARTAEMQDLFTRANLARLKRWVGKDTLLAFDFDGTLAPIVPSPEDAFMAKKTVMLAANLAALAKVAVVSGRGAADLRGRLGFKPRYIIGNHGLEGLHAGADRGGKKLRQARAICRTWRRQLAKSLGRARGIEIEDKSYSLSLHYRHAPDRRVAKVRILAAVEALKPCPRIINGKALFNLVPDLAADKGTAILQIMKSAGARRLFFIGDDDTDEEVFALTALARAGLFPVRVGRKRSSRARYFINRQSEINRLLEFLLECLR
jgi:trehalose 6-phosphate phosphatase